MTDGTSVKKLNLSNSGCQANERRCSMYITR